MLHPSYSDLIDVVNSEVEPGEQPVVQSRYSIVIATSKRARQLIAGEDAMVPSYGKKPLSVAIFRKMKSTADQQSRLHNDRDGFFLMA